VRVAPLLYCGESYHSLAQITYAMLSDLVAVGVLLLLIFLSCVLGPWNQSHLSIQFQSQGNLSTYFLGRGFLEKSFKSNVFSRESDRLQPNVITGLFVWT